MNIIYHVPDMAGLQSQIAASFTGLQAYSFMAFVLLYTPCLATVGVLRKEQLPGNGRYLRSPIRWRWLTS